MKNLKISYRILIFMFVLTLLAGALSLKLLSSMDVVNHQSSIISQNWLPSVEATSSLNTATSDFRLAECKHVGTTDPKTMDDAEKDLEALKKYIADLRQKYEPLISSPEEKSLYEQFSNDWDMYMKDHKTFLALSRNNQNAEASEVLYGDSLKQFNDASAVLLKLVELNSNGAHDASETGDSIYAHEKHMAIGGIVLMFILAGGCTFLLSRSVATPILQIRNYMGILSGGDLTQDVPFKERKDEIGAMALSLQGFKDSLLEAEKLRTKADQERLEKEARQDRVNQATARFEQSMSGIVKVVAAASTELQASAHTLAKAAEETSIQSNAVSAASTETSSNIQTVAASTEELSSSISEITQQVSRSSSVANDAVEKSRLAIQSIDKLLESAQKIGEVTSVISDISAQTNLLALNATIEAARAGDAGKGFAVVANEVKGLAANSAQSADQISTQITQIQEDTKIAARAVQDITKIIDQISETSSSIAAAIEEQAAATSEITRNVNEASNASIEVDQNIAGVSQSTASTGTAASQLSGAAEELSKQAEILKQEFDTYIHAINNA
ncbi:MAG: MCP four helix bundle domain-containing protein [Alphaproteobacteria bacterium]|nr:MCP four helix bundle domain-containing protein [Alphaproteobacteria bacterium]